MSSELPRVRELLELSRDSVLDTFKRNPIEVLEKSDVLELGTHPEFPSLLPEPVNLVITTELK
jgi:hypothetical protein